MSTSLSKNEPVIRQPAVAVPPVSSELQIYLDQPVNGSTRCTARMPVEGWFAFYEDILTDKSVPAVAVYLATTLTGDPISDPFSGRCVNASPNLDEPYCEHWSVSEDTRSGNDSRLVYRVSGVLNLDSLIPPDGELPRTLALKLILTLGPLVSESKTVVFSLAPRSDWQKPYGGLIAADSSRIYSDFLIVDGWAVRAGDELQRVRFRVNGVYIQDAELSLSKPEILKSLPDLPGIERAGFSTVMLRSVLSDVLSETRPDAAARNLQQELHIEAQCLFASGETLDVCMPWLLWLPAPHERTLMRGEVEEVSRAKDGSVFVRGWIASMRPESLRFSLCGGRGRVFLSDSQECRLFTREERPDVACLFPALVEEPSGFSFHVHPLTLGRFPGYLRLEAQDSESGERVMLGPRGMWSKLNSLIAEARPGISALERVGASLFRSAGEVRSFVPRSLFEWEKRQKAGQPERESCVTRPLRRVLAVFHNFSLVEGAPKILYGVLKALKENAEGLELLVISPRDGALRPLLEGLGATVRILPDVSVVGISYKRYRCGVCEAREIIRPFQPELCLANVVDNFWVIAVAQSFGIPAVWCLQESINPQRWFFELDQRLRYRFLQALCRVERVVFATEHTRKMFQPFVARERTAIIPNGIDLAAIRRRKSDMSREEARRRLGVLPESAIVSIVGTTCERKGQDIFVEEMALLRDEMPGQAFHFFVVGARNGEFLRRLKELSRRRGLDDSIVFVPETPDVCEFYLASDVMVISSREESAPLVSLEAFAYGVPLVSTTVFGLAEQIENEANALSFDCSVRGALAAQVRRLLEDKALSERLSSQAIDCLEQRFMLESSVRRYREEIYAVYSAYSRVAS